MFSKEELDHFETRLLREREGALEAIGAFDEQRTQTLNDKAGELGAYRLHPADIATESMEQEKEFLLASIEGRRLYEIDDALRKLYREPERFGICERCGEPISSERLDVIPQARHCARCQQEMESE